jgi:glutamyl/glutaminyl-tRNA synthetase
VSDVRSRFAPAPSGSIHVGNARSALFSWLYARHHEGAFVLRVEDTDASRVSEEAFRGVMESLRWLGLDWDEGPDVGGPHGPYRQSQRGDIYRAKVEQLLAQGDAYPCYCTEEELAERRRAATAAGEPPGYDGRCRTLTPQERAAREAEGRPKVIRFAMPERDFTVLSCAATPILMTAVMAQIGISSLIDVLSSSVYGSPLAIAGDVPRRPRPFVRSLDCGAAGREEERRAQQLESRRGSG